MYVGVHTGVNVRVWHPGMDMHRKQLGKGSGNGGQSGGLKPDGGCWVGTGIKGYPAARELQEQGIYFIPCLCLFYPRLAFQEAHSNNQVCSVSTDCGWSLRKHMLRQTNTFSGV